MARWLEKIRSKPEEKKIRLIWTICGVVVVLFLILWVFTSQIGKGPPADTSVFKTLDQGIKNFNAQPKNR